MSLNHFLHGNNSLHVATSSAVITTILGAVASLVDAPAISSSEVTWIVRIAFGAVLALNGYFIREAAKSFKQSQEQTRENTRDIRDLQEISEIVLTNMLVDSAGDPSIGRRKNDAILRIMLAKVTARRFLTSSVDNNNS